MMQHVTPVLIVTAKNMVLTETDDVGPINICVNAPFSNKVIDCI